VFVPRNVSTHLRFRSLCGAIGIAVVGSALLVGAAHADDTVPNPTDVVLVHECDRDVPDGWAVIEDASSYGGNVLVCNFRVNNESGVAVTVEYYCTAAEGIDAFNGKIGQRDTEILRTADRLVIEEGPGSKDPSVGHPDGVSSQFFPGVGFEFFRKAWAKFSDQIVATIVVLTSVPDFDTESQVNSVALALANAHIPPSIPGCEIPALPGITKPADGSGGGGAGVPIGIATAAGVVMVGGVVVWRRTKARKRPARDSSSVPPKCVAHEKAYTTARDTLLTLQEAQEEMAAHLTKAQRIQQHNMLRVAGIMGFEGGRTVGSAINLARQFRPRAWVPWQSVNATDFAKLNVGPEGLSAIERAQQFVSSATDAMAAAAKAVSEAAAKLRPSMLADNPLVRAAEDAVARSAARISKVSSELVDRLQRLRNTAIDSARNAKGTFDLHLASLKALEERHAQLKLALEQATTPSARGMLAREQRSVFEQIQAAIPRQAELKRLVESTASASTALTNEAAQAVAGTHSSIAALRQAHLDLRTQAQIARQNAYNQLNAGLQAAQQAYDAAARRVKLANGHMQVVARDALRSAVPTPPGLARRILHGGVGLVGKVLYPLTYVIDKAIEKTVGKTQSVPEAWEILQRGQQRVAELTWQLTMVERAINQQLGKVHTLNNALAECTGGPKAPPRLGHRIRMDRVTIGNRNLTPAEISKLKLKEPT
jgi:hypothetical protein